jgi:hypothetical protein
MDLVLSAAFFAAVTGSIVYTAFLQYAEKRRGLWREAAKAAGLTNVTFTRVAGFPTAMRARADPFWVKLDGYSPSDDWIGVTVTIGDLGGGDDALGFRRETLGTPLEMVMTRRGEVSLGDKAFDDAVYLRGSPQLACAVFDAHTRRVVTQMVAHGSSPGPDRAAMWVPIGEAQLSDGRLRVQVPSHPAQNHAAAALPGLLDLARRLARPQDIPARLARNLADDPHPGVRLSNLRALLEAYRRHPRTREALQAALGDANRGVRLLAAVELQARDTLLEIARDEDAPDAQAARAVQALGGGLGSEPLVEVLGVALRRRRVATARACLEHLGRAGDPEAVALLGKVLAVEKDELAEAAADALGRTRAPAAEGLLLSALAGAKLDHHERTGDAHVLVAVAEALGRLGSAAAVPPLRAAAERVRDGGFVRAARQAVAHIQARLQGAAPGQLSLAGGGAGQVSLTEDEAHGRVSLPDETETR